MSMALEGQVRDLQRRVKELEDAVAELTRIIAAAPQTQRKTLTLKPREGAPN